MSVYRYVDMFVLLSVYYIVFVYTSLITIAVFALRLDNSGREELAYRQLGCSRVRLVAQSFVVLWGARVP